MGGRRGGGAEWFAAPDADGAPSRGLRFECTMCGACCTGPPGDVLFTDEEAAVMAAHLGISVGAFLERFTRPAPDGAGRSLLEHETEHGLDCIFLDRRTTPGKAVCSLYEARPMQCRTFPWWPANVRSARDWSRLGRWCEGVGRGGFVPVEAIRIQRDRQAASDAG